MWRAICAATREVLLASELAPSSIAVVGLTGYGNGLYLVDRQGRLTRNGILSTDQRAQGEISRWRAEGLEEGVIALTYHRLWAGKPLPLIAWLETHEPESLKRAYRALMCKDYLRFRLTGTLAAEISDLSSGGLIDQRERRWTPAVIDHLGLGRYAPLFGETLEPLTVAGSEQRLAATSPAVRLADHRIHEPFEGARGIWAGVGQHEFARPRPGDGRGNGSVRDRRAASIEATSIICSRAAHGRARPASPAGLRAVGRGSRFSPRPLTCRSSFRARANSARWARRSSPPSALESIPIWKPPSSR
jgi:hypothetical protein